MTCTSRIFVALVATVLLTTPVASAQKAPTPSEFLKIDVGGDGVLATYEQIASYWKAIDPLSDRITVQELGQTTMGHQYIVAIITSPENQRKLDYYRELNNRLYDPRRTSEEEAKKLIAEGKTIVVVQCAIHSTEVGAPQMSMELAYRFATENTPRLLDVLLQDALGTATSGAWRARRRRSRRLVTSKAFPAVCEGA